MRKITCLLLLFLILESNAQTPLKPRDASINGPQTFAIVLGVSKYKYVKPLAFADKDALLFKDYLKSPGGGSVKDENIFLLLNEKASNANFWGKGFQWLKAKNLRRGDRLFIYLAGHGDAIDEDQFFFLGYDCNPAGDKNNYPVAGAIQLFNLKKKIAAETTKGVEVFFIMDACRSNELPGGARGQNFLNTAISEKKAGEMIMLATGAGQESLEDVSIGSGQGLFTYYLVEGLTGMADSTGRIDNQVTFQEIQRYVNNNVPSIAQQRFKRKQDPYFCCNENSEKVISTVNAAYLQRWLQTKKQQRRGPGNSYNGVMKPYETTWADTLLIETYNSFNRAISNNNITGNGSAEDYFRQLNTKFPDNPYTLDARSSLAVEYINFAQAKIDRYLVCGEQRSDAEKRDNEEAANRLDRAIQYVRQDDEDFANSLLPRLFFLRSGGTGNASSLLQNAYASLSIDREGAYVQNRLALLHLENNNLDSAIIYADRAIRTAPNWLCAITTMALVRKKMEQPSKQNPNNAVKRISSFGVFLGGGLSRLTPTYRDAPNSNVIGVNPRDIPKIEFGLVYQLGLGTKISVKPSALFSFEGSDLVYESRAPTGGPITRDSLHLRQTCLGVSVPFMFYLSNKKIAPYFFAGPSFSYVLAEKETDRSIPVKKSAFIADAGFGADIQVGKGKVILAPEIKYSQGLNNIREDAGNIFTDNISSLRRRGFTVTLTLKKGK